MKATPVMRPEVVLLLQPGSTAISQTTKNRIAKDAIVLSNIFAPLITDWHAWTTLAVTTVTTCRNLVAKHFLGVLSGLSGKHGFDFAVVYSSIPWNPSPIS